MQYYTITSFIVSNYYSNCVCYLVDRVCVRINIECNAVIKNNNEELHYPLQQQRVSYTIVSVAIDIIPNTRNIWINNSA